LPKILALQKSNYNSSVDRTVGVVVFFLVRRKEGALKGVVVFFLARFGPLRALRLAALRVRLLVKYNFDHRRFNDLRVSSCRAPRRRRR
jgi:hypothetical protein